VFAPLLLCTAHAQSDADWARARLNDGGNISAKAFTYPATTQKVRLYLVDSAVKQGNNAYGNWFKKNAKLTLKPTVRVNSGTSQAFEHATQLLSIIAGPETGVALGTPIEALNYDIYMGKDPNGVSDSGSIATTLYQIRTHHLSSSPRLPGVICLASSSENPATSPMMEDAVNVCVAAGLTVVVSAGNENRDASLFVPAAYGTKPGVICVGASKKDNTKYPTSNFGAAVDLYAPGEGVRTLRYGDGGPKSGVYELMNETSPACGLTAAAALVELSKNPSLTPAQVEENLKAAAYVPPPAPEAQAVEKLVQVEPEPEVDSDGDGASDSLETFFATDANDPAVWPDPLLLDVVDGQLAASFQIAAGLFDSEEPYLLTNGGIWSVQYSEDLVTWLDAEGTLVPGDTASGKRAMNFSAPAATATGFIRIQVSMPAPAP
jgi:hypothetical protein